MSVFVKKKSCDIHIWQQYQFLSELWHFLNSEKLKTWMPVHSYWSIFKNKISFYFYLQEMHQDTWIGFLVQSITVHNVHLLLMNVAFFIVTQERILVKSPSNVICVLNPLLKNTILMIIKVLFTLEISLIIVKFVRKLLLLKRISKDIFMFIKDSVPFSINIYFLNFWNFFPVNDCIVCFYYLFKILCV